MIMTNTISILGSTGSIGRQTLEVAEHMGLRVGAITANSSVELMEEQVRKFRPALAVLTDEAAAKDLQTRIADTDTKVIGGFDIAGFHSLILQFISIIFAVIPYTVNGFNKTFVLPCTDLFS